MSGHKACYLDGRYISLVLRDVPEFIPEPIIVEVSFDVDGNVLTASIRSDFFRLHPGMNIVRVVVRSTYMAHSALLWIDTTHKVVTYTDTVSSQHQTIGDKVHPIVDGLLHRFVDVFTKYPLVVERILTPDTIQTNCDVYGFCNAYVIKQVQDYANDVVFDSYSFDVLQFIEEVERDYHQFLNPLGRPEIEYYSNSNGRRNAALGAVVGTGLGAALGAAVGTGIGAAAGTAFGADATISAAVGAAVGTAIGAAADAALATTIVPSAPEPTTAPPSTNAAAPGYYPYGYA